MKKFFQFLIDGLRLLTWLIWMLASLFLCLAMRITCDNLPSWLIVIFINPALIFTCIILSATAFCWVFGLKFSPEDPPDWYHLFEDLFNFKSFSAFLRGVGYILVIIFSAMLFCYFHPSDREGLPEAPMRYRQTDSSSK